MEADNGDPSHMGLLPRPAIYYGEGPFNAPSSDEEEEVEKEPIYLCVARVSCRTCSFRKIPVQYSPDRKGACFVDGRVTSTPADNVVEVARVER